MIILGAGIMDDADSLSRQVSLTLSDFGVTPPEGSEDVVLEYFIGSTPEEDNGSDCDDGASTSDIQLTENVFITYQKLLPWIYHHNFSLWGFISSDLTLFPYLLS